MLRFVGTIALGFVVIFITGFFEAIAAHLGWWEWFHDLSFEAGMAYMAIYFHREVNQGSDEKS